MIANYRLQITDCRLRHGLIAVMSLLALVLLVRPASASLCVWRQPDEDIASIYNADSYKTVFEDIADAQRARIEEKLGYELDPDETQFKFFPVFKADDQVGTVMTHAGKGQFGVIEVVVAVIDTGTGAIVRAVRIQRDREKAKEAIRSREFLSQFKNMTSTDGFEIGTDLKTAEDGAERSSQAIANAVRKLLIVYDEFNAPGGGGTQ
jgi:hypothetical protein